MTNTTDVGKKDPDSRTSPQRRAVAIGSKAWMHGLTVVIGAFAVVKRSSSV
jgi:hypothetical protein